MEGLKNPLAFLLLLLLLLLLQQPPLSVIDVNSVLLARWSQCFGIIDWNVDRLRRAMQSSRIEVDAVVARRSLHNVWNFGNHLIICDWNTTLSPIRSCNMFACVIWVWSLICFQICSFFMSAAVQCTAFARWRKWSELEKNNGWRLYGRFTALSFTGSVAGVLGYVSRLGQLHYTYITRTAPPQQNRDHFVEVLQESRLVMLTNAAYHVMNPLELALVSVAKLLVLHRMQRFATIKSARKRLWRIAGRAFLGAVITGHAVGIAGNVASAVFYDEAAELYGNAAKALAANDTTVSAVYEVLAREKRSDATRILSVQRFSEMTVVLIIIAAFLVVGINSHRIIASALQALFNAEKKLVAVAGAVGDVSSLLTEAQSQGRLLRRKVCATFVFVFMSFLLRSVIAVMNAVGSALNNSSDRCARSQCDPCKNAYTQMLFWMIYTPMFQQTVVLVASPVALSVALWGMSNLRPIEQMRCMDGTTVASTQHPPVPSSQAASRLHSEQ